jgi:hypothetical protein
MRRRSKDIEETFVRTSVVIAVFSAVVVAGCGGSGASEANSGAVTNTPKDLATLVETCPEMEAAMPGDAILSEPAEWKATGERLSELREAGDTETKNAIDLLLPAVEVLANDPKRGQESVDADQGLISALDAVRTRCEAVGSSGFA